MAWLEDHQDLDTERFYKFKKYFGRQNLNQIFELASLPQTTGASVKHILRVYHQIQE